MGLHPPAAGTARRRTSRGLERERPPIGALPAHATVIGEHAASLRRAGRRRSSSRTSCSTRRRARPGRRAARTCARSRGSSGRATSAATRRSSAATYRRVLDRRRVQGARRVEHHDLPRPLEQGARRIRRPLVSRPLGEPRRRNDHEQFEEHLRQRVALDARRHARHRHAVPRHDVRRSREDRHRPPADDGHVHRRRSERVRQRMPPKAVAPFSWGEAAPYTSYRADKFVETAARMMARRHVELSDRARRHLSRVHAARGPRGRRVVKIWVLGSGSRGNAVLVDCDGSRMLVDCGYGTRTLASRLKAIGVKPESIDGCADHARTHRPRQWSRRGGKALGVEPLRHGRHRVSRRAHGQARKPLRAGDDDRLSVHDGDVDAESRTTRPNRSDS